MTNRNPDTSYGSMPQALRFVLEQHVKTLNICMPAHIVSYDAAERRAVVLPALGMLASDGQHVSPLQIADVPVLFPSGGGFTLTLPLGSGDPVLLVFSQRGLTGFKRGHGSSAPDEDSLLDLRDAVAIPGFGPSPLQPITPVSTAGAVLQDHAGENYIALETDGISIKTTGRVTLQDENGTSML